ncbi:uncharacterized protein EI90DRAFT_2911026, partial [Cantharellus anzutake]|uniref:uncharacterized protein n=1 Tax=Cantharellus anzutake TaxID=1750568 RepID=UPI001906F0AC
SVKHVPSWFPFAGFKRQARTWAKIAHNSLELPFEVTKQDVVRRLTPLPTSLSDMPA